MNVVHEIPLAPPFRPARPEDAPALVDFIDYASSGMAPIAWAQAAGPERGAQSFGLDLVRGHGTMSYRNAVVADHGQGAVAALITHALPPEPQPIPSDPIGLTTPWQQLKNTACGAWHIAVLAAYPQHRSRGLGSALLVLADAQRQAYGSRLLSLLVADANIDARRLYARFGFREEAQRPMTEGSWTNPGKEWLLLIRDA